MKPEREGGVNGGNCFLPQQEILWGNLFSDMEIVLKKPIRPELAGTDLATTLLRCQKGPSQPNLTRKLENLTRNLESLAKNLSNLARTLKNPRQFHLRWNQFHMSFRRILYKIAGRVPLSPDSCFSSQ